MNEAKNKKIKETLKLTKARRATQQLFIREVKVDLSRCNQETLSYFESVMQQAKWIKNNAIEQQNIFKAPYNLKTVPVKYVQNGNVVEEQRALDRIAVQSQQYCINELKSAITSLSATKKKGKVVGKLKFIKEVNSVGYIHAGTTYHLKHNEKGELTHVRLAKNKQWIKVIGGHQLVGIDEIADIKLVRKPSGWYILITCCIASDSFETWKASFSKTPIPEKREVVGVDLGIKTTACYSDNDIEQNRGELDIKITETKQLKQIQQKLAKLLKIIKQTVEYKQNKNYRTNGYLKLIHKLRLVWERIVNRRRTKAKQFVSFLSRRYNVIVFQDEQIVGWAKGLFGKQVQNSALGTIKSELKRLIKYNRVIMLDKWQPTTKLCPRCNAKNDIALSERVYRCGCGFSDHRDYKSADTMWVIAGYRFTSKTV